VFKLVGSRIRGYAAERFVVSKLREHGFAVIRAPASGSKRKDHVPDIVAMKRGVIILIEMKSRSGEGKVYLDKSQIEGIEEFAEKSGGEGFLGIKMPRLLKFIRIDKLKKTTGGNYVVDEQILEEGLSLEDLVRYVESKWSKRLDSFL
jgi:Holliday junction resolvase